LVVEVDANAVRIGFDRQFAVSIADGHGIMIGVQGDAELARGKTREGTAECIRGRVERPEMRSFLHQQIDRSLLSLAVDSYVGDGVEPNLYSGLGGGQIARLGGVLVLFFLYT